MKSLYTHYRLSTPVPGSCHPSPTLIPIPELPYHPRPCRSVPGSPPNPSQPIHTHLRPPTNPVVLKLGSIEPKGFGELVSGVQWFGLVGWFMTVSLCQVQQQLFKTTTLSTFWCHQIVAYPPKAKKALKVLIPFVKTYLCGQSFSRMVDIKTKKRNSSAVRYVFSFIIFGDLENYTFLESLGLTESEKQCLHFFEARNTWPHYI